jgi:hypothetical protein
MGRNGSYKRRLPVRGGWTWGPIYRRLCRHCNISWSILPGFVLPRRRYSLTLVVAWLLAWLHGTPFRDREFLVSQGVPVPEADVTMSWSDLLDSEPTRPSYQLLFHWVRDYQRRAATLLTSLVPSADRRDIELKTLAYLLEREEFSVFRASPLVLATGLLHLLSEARQPDPSVELSLSELVRILSARQLPRSHQVLRVSGGRIRYDTIVV